VIACLVVMASLPAGVPGREATDWTTSEPFEWDPGFASPGTSLTVEEVARHRTNGSTAIEYRFLARGFAPDEDAWMWMKQGPAYRPLPAVIDSLGEVAVADAELFLIAGYVRGQALDVALVSGDKRAQAKVFPFPIQSEGDGCLITAELVTPLGNVFVITVTGLDVGEWVLLESIFKGERVEHVFEVPEDGSIKMAAVFGPEDRGTAVVKVIGRDVSASLEYDVGEDALETQ